MEIKGKPGDAVWIRATLRKIVVTESGVEYYANPAGTDSRFSFKAEDIKIDPMPKSEALTKALEEVCDAAKAQVYDAMLVNPEAAAAEDLMHKADQALAESPLYEDEKRRKKDGR